MDHKSGLPGAVGQVSASIGPGGTASAPKPADVQKATVAAAATMQANVQFVLRYATEIKQLAACPPKGVSALDIVGFRFAFEDIEHPDNYLPVAVVKPERAIAGQPVTQCCTGYSLSVFDSLESLARKAQKALKTSPLFLRRVGDHFIRLKITPDAGVCTVPSDSGHFDLFEADSFSCRGAVLSHERLPL
ncbi:hypothetical protein [Burkholderia stabilis]|uniref:hypothetical protein n=1 Tax=Burkholderia stabilis TaxID=95485 RepID=UPI001146BA81|nr:hypothetical protein [Burkholderia stabilis]